PALVALVLGGVGGVVAALRLRHHDADDEATTLADLEERAAHAIQMLRDLDEQALRMEPDAYQGERDRLEELAAAALRQHDERASAAAKAPTQAKAPKPSSGTQVGPAKGPGQLRGFAWGVGTMAVVFFLYVLVTQESAPRAPGGS